MVDTSIPSQKTVSLKEMEKLSKYGDDDNENNSDSDNSKW